MKSFSISKKIGLIMFVSIVLPSFILIVYNLIAFRNGIHREFEERITVLGENLSI